MGNKYKVNDNGKTFDEEEKRLIISTHSMLTSFWKRQWRWCPWAYLITVAQTRTSVGARAQHGSTTPNCGAIVGTVLEHEEGMYLFVPLASVQQTKKNKIEEVLHQLIIDIEESCCSSTTTILVLLNICSCLFLSLPLFQIIIFIYYYYLFIIHSLSSPSLLFILFRIYYIYFLLLLIILHDDDDEIL
jgi:hypothetical protein